MTKYELLRSISETGYNVGFGAKKHFATYDIVEKAPGFISFLSLAFGIYALAFNGLSTKFLSASFIVLGVIGLYISLYEHKKSEYMSVGVKLTQLYNELGRLYRDAKSADDDGIENLAIKFVRLQNTYYELCLSKQILFSDWYAHYKFFWQHQIEWVDEQKKFKLFRDKIPLTFSMFIVFLFVALIALRVELLVQVCQAVSP